MSKYILAVENLYRIEAETEEEAHAKMRQKLKDGEFYDADNTVLETVDVEDEP